MSQQTLTVYRASAGSGKTFTLAIQYIKLLIANNNPYAFKQILAVTFTNKATGEMKDRILQQLYGIWKGLESSKSYIEVLKKELEKDQILLDTDEIRERAGKALTYILHDYNYFRVETIDSFFQSVMRNMAHELSLTANLKVDLNDNEVLNEAVDRIFERLHLTPVIFKWILEYVNDRIDNNQSWNVAKDVKTFGKYLFKECYLSNEEALTQILHDDKKIRSFRDALKEQADSATDIVKSCAEHFREEMNRYGVGFEHFSRGSTLNTYLTNLENGVTKADFGSTLEKYTADPINMLKKADQKDTALLNVATNLHELLKETRQLQLKAHILSTTATITQKHLNPLRLLGAINEEITDINYEKDKFLLAKTPILLKDLIDDQDAPFIYEKIGTRFNHIMIDEFQDTSTMQWDNFKVLLKENMASGFNNLIVGDIKQSIYRWRNGDWRILNNIEQELKQFTPQIRNLSFNFRSERRIINFNNAFFCKAASLLDQLAPQAPIKIAEAYADVAQEAPSKKQESGYVFTRFYADEKNNTDSETHMLEELCEKVRELHQQGIPYNEMAILIRKKKMAEPILNYFSKELPEAKIISDEAFLLSSSTAINIIINALRYLNNAEDKIALAYLKLYTPQITEKTKDIDAYALISNGPVITSDFYDRTEELKNLPLYELVEELYKIFKLNTYHAEDAFVFAFFDNLNSFIQENPSDIGSFINYWDETLNGKSIPSGEVEGIRVLTIHASKGLQFHTVLMPYCDWDIEKDKSGYNADSDLLWCNSDEPPYNTLPVIPITPQKNMSDSLYKEDYEDEHLQRRIDTLNLIYVAFTRAEKNLFIWCKTKYELKESSVTGDLIYASLPLSLSDTNITKNTDDKIETYEYGQPITESHKSSSENDNRLEIDYVGKKVEMNSFDTKFEFCQSNQAEEFINSMKMAEGEEHQQSSDKRLLGILLHKLFSRIYTQNDVQKVILSLETEGLLQETSEKEIIIKKVEKAFELPQVREWFDGTKTLYNECPILSKKYDREMGKYKTYRPDRVMYGKDTIDVVDFKFGQKNDEYKKQVREYMDLLKEMEPDKKVRGYLWYILNNQIEEIKA